MKMTTNVIPTDRVLTRKDPTFVAVSVDIRLTDVTAQVFVLLVLICSIRCWNEWEKGRYKMTNTLVNSGNFVNNNPILMKKFK